MIEAGIRRLFVGSIDVTRRHVRSGVVTHVEGRSEMKRSMKGALLVCAALFVSLSQVSCATAGNQDGADTTKAPAPVGGVTMRNAPSAGAGAKEIAPSYVDFGFDLYRALLAGTAGENNFISPASVGFALAMTYNGAHGKTAEAMSLVLGFSGMSLGQVNAADSSLIAKTDEKIKGVELSVANSLWARRGIEFKKDFLARNARAYGAQIESLDFASPQAAGKINAWVASKTNDKIKEIVDRVDASSILFLVNAVYFKGSWTEAFDKGETHEDTFYVKGVTPKLVPLMRKGGDWRYLKGDGFQAVSLPYDEGRLSMYVFLPDARRGLGDFEKRLSADAWNGWMKSFEERNGRVVMPRFRLERTYKLKDALSSLGMGVAFDGGTADFSGMVVRPMENVFIYDVVHKTFVDVNEEGTEAAAATSVEMRLTSVAMPQHPFEMIVDHPFFFAIRDNETGLILFMGSVVSP
jgi:serine protease inhibitor